MWFIFRLLKKIAYEIAKAILSRFFEKLFLSAKKRFSLKEKNLPEYQKKTLTMLRGKGLRPANTFTATNRAVSEITEAIADFLHKDIDADQRKFGINFLDHYTNDMTIEEMLKALSKLDPRDLACIVKAVIGELQLDPAVKLISTRDVFNDVVRTVEVECKGFFNEVELLEPHLGHSNDQAGYLSQTLANVSSYGGVDPDIPYGSHTFKEMRKIQEDMKAIGLKTAKQKCSRTHIVMSAAIGDGWLKNSNSEERYMVITAGKSDKTNLLIPSQTPVVKKKEDKLIYYGDSSSRPSSELLSHWTMHEKLLGISNEWSKLRCIFHAHLIDIIDLSRRYQNKSELPLGNQLAPNIDWCYHGTHELGEKIINEIITKNTHVAIVKQHGPWFFAPTLQEAYEDAMNTVKNIKLPTS